MRSSWTLFFSGLTSARSVSIYEFVPHSGAEALGDLDDLQHRCMGAVRGRQGLPAFKGCQTIVVVVMRCAGDKLYKSMCGGGGFDDIVEV